LARDQVGEVGGVEVEGDLGGIGERVEVGGPLAVGAVEGADPEAGAGGDLELGGHD
jgi:hypothetical protein